MRVIITGGTGLIGRAVAAELAKQYEVVILSRNPERQSNLPSGVKVEKWDGKTAESWGKLADGAYAIVNLAGAGIADQRWTKARKELITNSRIWAGQAVVAAVQQAKVKPKVVIQASAIGYYQSKSDSPLDESAEAGKDFQAQVCKVWEPSSAEVTRFGVRHIVARFGVVLSMEGGALPKMVGPVRWGGGVLGTGEQWLSWIHIFDVARALRFLLEQPDAQGVYNLTAPAAIINERFIQIIGTILETPTFFPAPDFALKLLLGEMATIVLDGVRVEPARLHQEGFQFRFGDAESALRDLLLKGKK